MQRRGWGTTGVAMAVRDGPPLRCLTFFGARGDVASSVTGVALLIRCGRGGGLRLSLFRDFRRSGIWKRQVGLLVFAGSLPGRCAGGGVLVRLWRLGAR